MRNELESWLESGEHLPVMLRDFHDRKDVLKSIYYLYQDSPSKDRVPDLYASHIFLTDWFLWYMASRGYTLQKSRKRVPFRTHLSFRELTVHDHFYNTNINLDLCPFCGCKMRIETNRDWHRLKGDHEGDCFFEFDREDDYPATIEGLNELLLHWNKRS